MHLIPLAKKPMDVEVLKGVLPDTIFETGA